MSYTFDIGDDTIWGPANSVARIFLGTVRTLAEEYRIPSGVGDDLMGMVEIDPVAFPEFVQRVLTERANSLHMYKDMMLDGVLPILIAMADRGRLGVVGGTPEERAYLEGVRARRLPMLAPSE
ncbi:DUF6086 family protein [Streptomyces sp. NPDC006553]|uniref:DUF6086 family protein n=1 Tax=unclassified Streptomyces TaxID=2593676 RepID=UPI0022513425|nr:DUF6086 family protein [Streptomyces sp. NBC_00233]MCX5227766.1 DUF6086 family protein [Streptomyces sp. NBC_00233]